MKKVNGTASPLAVSTPGQRTKTSDSVERITLAQARERGLWQLHDECSVPAESWMLDNFVSDMLRGDVVAGGAIQCAIVESRGGRGHAAAVWRGGHYHTARDLT